MYCILSEVFYYLSSCLFVRLEQESKRLFILLNVSQSGNTDTVLLSYNAVSQNSKSVTLKSSLIINFAAKMAE